MKKWKPSELICIELFPVFLFKRLVCAREKKKRNDDYEIILKKKREANY